MAIDVRLEQAAAALLEIGRRVPAGAEEWLARHYAALGPVEVIAMRVFGEGNHRLTELACFVGDSDEPTFFLVAEDVEDAHPQGGVVSAPMTYSEVAHTLANVTALELSVIGNRVNDAGAPSCPRAAEPHPPGEPLEDLTPTRTRARLIEAEARIEVLERQLAAARGER